MEPEEVCDMTVNATELRRSVRHMSEEALPTMLMGMVKEGYGLLRCSTGNCLRGEELVCDNTVYCGWRSSKATG